VEILAENHSTLTESLQSAGYATAGISTNVMASRSRGFAQGFDHFDDEACRWKDADCAFGLAGDWLTRHLSTAPEQPFLLLVHLFDPHFDKRGRPPRYQPAEGYETLFGEPETPDRVEKIRIDYDRKIRFSDDRIAAFITALEATGIADDLLIVIASDHGEEFFEKRRWGHSGALTNSLVRVPLVIRLPGRVGGGRIVDEPVANVDIGPTVLDLLGVEAPPGFEGRSLRPAMEGRPSEPRLIYGDLRRFGRNERYIVDPVTKRKFVVDFNQGSRQLYDIEADPDELRDLAEAEPKTAERLQARLEAMMAAMDERRGRPENVSTVPPSEIEQLKLLGYLLGGGRTK